MSSVLLQMQGISVYAFEIAVSFLGTTLKHDVFYDKI